MFVNLENDGAFKHVLIGSLAAPDRGVFTTSLVCERVYFAGRRGICLAEARNEDAPVTVWADVFSERLERLHRFPLKGTPSRVRLSPDGRLAAATLFAHGHSYAEHGFATTTTIFDLDSGTVAVEDLEALTIRRDGAAIRAVDFNLWGVTFAHDSDTFYATLATGGRNYLVRGRMETRTADIIHEGVECPSLSPDNARIAFKKRIGGSGGWWQIAVLDLATMTERSLFTESRSLDDQVEWLDDGHLAYHLTGASTAADLWSLAIDGATPPRLMLAGAYSPAAVHDDAFRTIGAEPGSAPGASPDVRLSK